MKKKLIALFNQLKDRTNIVIFCICFLVLSSEVWVPYIIGFVTGSKWWFGIGSACWAFWLAPFTPFLPICIACTFAIRKIYDKIKVKHMILKPKMTMGNPKALVYRRYTAILAANTMKTVYKTEWKGNTTAYWLFNKDEMKFIMLESGVDTSESDIVNITTGTTVLEYNYPDYYTGGKRTKYFKFLDYKWQETTGGNNPILAQFGNVSQYQLNKYGFAGSFDYITNGDIEGATTQIVKGNIVPLRSLTVKYYSDDIVLCPDDLVVIDSRLYSVENPTTSHNHTPRDYKVYFATLNSVL